jgi:Tfp pilus assembly protein PilF
MPRLLSFLLPLCAASMAAQSLTDAAVRHVQAAQQAQARQDCSTAAKQFGLAAQLTPKSGELRSNEGVALYCDGQWERAIVAFHKALMLNRSLSAPHMFLGLVAYHLSDPRTAVSELGTYLSVKPDDMLARLWLGYAEAAEHQNAEASKSFLMITTSHPENVDAEYALGQSWLELGREAVRRLQTLNPESPYLFRLAGEQYRTVGDETRAGKAFAMEATKQQVRAGAPVSSAAEEAQLYQQAHDAEAKAQSAFDAVMANAPESDRAHEIRADALLLQQQDRAALLEYRAVAKINPSLPGVHEAIATCLMRQSEFAEALTEMQMELKLQPQSPEVLMELGRVQFAMGNTAATLTSLQRAAVRNDAPVETYLLLARASLQNNDAKAATTALLTYIARQPDSSSAHFLLARAYRIQGDRAAMAKEIAAYQRLSKNTEEQQLVHAITEAPNHVAEQSLAGTPNEADTNSLPPSNH